MYLLYLDDSGSPGNKNEEYFVLGGLCIPEASVRWLSHELEKLSVSICPNEPEKVEFHAAEIFRGKSFPWNQIPDKQKRVQIIRDVLCILNKAYSDVVSFACAIHKQSYPNEDPVLKAYEDLASRFNMHLEYNVGTTEAKQKGLIILDKSSYETGLQSLAISIRKGGNRWGIQMRNIVEVPLFIDSQASRLIQLADHIAYAVFRRYEASDLTYFNCIEDRFYQKDHVMHGLAHKQTINRNCTCPACLTRR